jgi:N-methylhydantoinase A
MGFGGAGPLHVNAVARLMGSYPAVSPVSPGVLCALGDATTRMRTETARSLSKRLSQTSLEEVLSLLKEMEAQVRADLIADGIPATAVETAFEIDVRYSGQAFEVPMVVTSAELTSGGLVDLTKRFDEEHRRLFTFNMDAEHELVNLRATAMGGVVELPSHTLKKGDGDPAQAKLRDHTLWMDGAEQAAAIYDRSKLEAGDVIKGPAIVTEMDSTTLIETRHIGTVDSHGNILITPV